MVLFDIMVGHKRIGKKEMTVIDKLFHWVYYVMKLSMIYVVLLISGFFLLGFSPANASLMTLYNKHRTAAEKYTFSEAFAEFKSTFKLSNNVFLIVAMIALGLLYTLWGLSHMTPSFVVYFFLIMTLLASLFLASFYAVYLKLQVYYDFKLKDALSLSFIAIFFHWLSICKCLLGTVVLLVIGRHLPLVLVVFLPVFWLIFTFDILEPIYKQVSKQGL
ncbi:hypothetical protein BKX95_02550 [Streptococcus iniae]|nr:hypothetical protein BKX95_02550 [Streptococcus iniae]